MKPNFALKLSNDGAQLLHRSGALWVPVGAVSFTDDDVATACERLVTAAKALAPEGLRTKLVIPPSEIRYEVVLAPGPTDEARRYQIEAEIERLTPYSVSELAYDFAVEDDSVLVAICARETLAEAETFAEGYGFNPVSCVAIPEAGEFNGEPWFGETTVARAYLPPGGKVQRDSEAIRIGAAVARSAPVAPVSAPVPAPVAPPVSPATAAAPPVSAPVAPPVAAPVTPPAAPPVTPPAPPPVAAPVAPAAPPRPAPVSAPAMTRGTPAAPVKPPVSALPLARAPAAAPADDSASSRVGDLVRRVGNRLRREQAAQVSAARRTPEAEAPPEGAPPIARAVSAPAAESATEPVAFSSRRAAAPSVVAKGPAPVATGPGPGGRIAVLPGAKAMGTAPAALLRKSQEGMRAGFARLRALKPAPRPAPEPAPVVATSRPPATERDRLREKEALTIFGARGNPVPEVSLARRGLLAAGAVLALLFAVAIWALYGASTDTQLAEPASDTPAEVAALPSIAPPAELAAPDTAAPAATAPIAAPESVAAAPVETAPAEEPAAETLAAADPEQLLDDLTAAAREETVPTPPAPVEQALSEQAAAPDEAQAAAAPELRDVSPQANTASATPAAEPGTASAGGADVPAVALSEVPEQRLSLPGPLTPPPLGEVAFATPAPPPPFGSTFVFDANGLVEATPTGALTPSGVTVFARRPSVSPAPAPGRAAAAAPVPAAPAAPAPADIASAVESALAEAVTEAAPAAPAAETEVVYDDTPRADPALAGARPQAPPARVREIRAQAAPAVPEPTDDQTLLAPSSPGPETDTAALDAPPPGGVSLAALRPQRRPTDLVPAETPAPEQPAAADAQTAADLAGATPQAVAASPIPGARPESIPERARQILAAASAPQPAQGGGSATPEILEDEADEPAGGGAPSIPSSASVARQATETNAINLSEVNLIGVFGTAGDRRALVRLPSGRMVRVGVGDRLEGGQVTAIGEGELRYTAGGSNQVLRIGG